MQRTELPYTERLSFVWLDTPVELRRDTVDMQVKLRNILDYLRIFDRTEPCEQYVRHINTHMEKLFFIIHGSLCATFVPHIHDLPQIKYIYIYESDKSTPGQQWLAKYPKIRGVFTDSKQLIAQIIRDKARG
ncbi:unnamed protein product [Didymodactylos carnosus]|uniref:Uncharacterized protein n=1 Tax=Didymodactylos carnosus TaxID=1234261 RepID=A0A815AL70_9BILA|nr:unnamed protein product [Didymodactylos carnosus]CAF4034666.1 unnamed protein product [Didymodactylos carnosus]